MLHGHKERDQTVSRQSETDTRTLARAFSKPSDNTRLSISPRRYILTWSQGNERPIRDIPENRLLDLPVEVDLFMSPVCSLSEFLHRL